MPDLPSPAAPRVEGAAGAAPGPVAPDGTPRRPGAFLRDSAAIALGQYVARGMVLARGWAAAAALGPGGFGIWNALNLIFDYGSYATAGALQGLDLRLPPAVAEGDAPRARRLMAGAWSIVLSGGALFAVLVAATLRWAPVPAGALHLAILMLATALLQLAFQYLSTAVRGYGRCGAVSEGQAVQSVVG